jgi:hypothetical protein
LQSGGTKVIHLGGKNSNLFNQPSWQSGGGPKKDSSPKSMWGGNINKISSWQNGGKFITQTGGWGRKN